MPLMTAPSRPSLRGGEVRCFTTTTNHHVCVACVCNWSVLQPPPEEVLYHFYSIVEHVLEEHAVTQGGYYGQAREWVGDAEVGNVTAGEVENGYDEDKPAPETVEVEGMEVDQTRGKDVEGVPTETEAAAKEEEEAENMEEDKQQDVVEVEEAQVEDIAKDGEAEEKAAVLDEPEGLAAEQAAKGMEDDENTPESSSAEEVEGVKEGTDHQPVSGDAETGRIAEDNDTSAEEQLKEDEAMSELVASAPLIVVHCTHGLCPADCLFHR